MKLATFVTTSLLALSVSSALHAQDMVVMRKAISSKTSSSTAPVGTPASSTPAASPKGEWTTSAAAADSPSCSDSAPAHRTVWCAGPSGILPDSACSGAKPSSATTVSDHAGCAFSWKETDWSDWASSCSDRTSRTRSVFCRRSDGTVAPDDACSEPKPETQQSGAYTAGCTFQWQPGEWGSWSSACSPTATRTRTVICSRSDETTAPDSSCGGTKPPTTDDAGNLAGCSYHWTQGDWTTAPACGSSSRSRTVTCVRQDGTTVGDDECVSAGTRPTTSEPIDDFSSCSFAWHEGDWGPWADGCSGQTSRSRSVQCLRSDATVADDASCAPTAKPDVTQSGSNFASCGYSWQSGDWAVVPACGDTTETRTIECLRSDRTAVDDSQCGSSGIRPPASQATTDFTSCTFSWIAGDYGAWSSTCQAGATRSRTVTCARSDGTPADASSCDPAKKPDASETGDVFSGCGYAWKTGDWSAPGSTCSDHAPQTRTVSCLRQDGTTVDPSACDPATMPPASQSVVDVSGCVPYYFTAGGWGDWDSHCSANANRYRTIGCFRDEGFCQTSDPDFWYDYGSGNCSKHRPDAECSDPASATKGYSPADGHETAAVYDGCTFTTTYGPYGSCYYSGSGGSMDRSVTCTRSDNTVVDPSNCNSSGTQTSVCGTADETQGADLQAGQRATSPNGRYSLLMGTDGNLTFNDGSTVLWQTGTSGSNYFAHQNDGNLVVYPTTGASASTAKWNSVTYGNPGAYYTVTNSGHFVIYRVDHTVLETLY